MQHCILAFATLGVPRKIKTDNGPAYTSKFFQSFLKGWNIQYNTGILYNPQGQTIIERIHLSLKKSTAQTKTKQNTESKFTLHVFKFCYLCSKFSKPST